MAKSPTPSDARAQDPGNRFLTPQRRVVLAATVGNAVSGTPALFTVFGLLLVPIATDFHWPRAWVAGVLGIVGPIGALFAVIAGYAGDRFGPRRVTLWGNALFALGMMAMAFAPASVPLFYAMFCATAIAAAFAAPTLYGKAVAGWYDEGRGQALGFAAGVGNGSGSTLMPVVAGILVTLAGWRGAFLGVGAVILLLGFPTLYAFLRDPPERTIASGRPELEGMSLRAALRSPVLWLMLLSIGLCASCMTAMFTQVVPVLSEHGVGLGRAIPVISVFALVCAAWQWASGAIIDRIGHPAVMLPFYLLSVAGLLLLQHATTTPALILAGTLMGLGLGTEYSGMTLLVSRYFGVRHFGAIVGLLYAVVNLVKGVIPFGMNAAFDATGSYHLPLAIMEGVMVASALVLLLLPRFGRAARKPATMVPPLPA